MVNVLIQDALTLIATFAIKETKILVTSAESNFTWIKEFALTLIVMTLIAFNVHKIKRHASNVPLDMI